MRKKWYFDLCEFCIRNYGDLKMWIKDRIRDKNIGEKSISNGIGYEKLWVIEIFEEKLSKKSVMRVVAAIHILPVVGSRVIDVCPCLSVYWSIHNYDKTNTFTIQHNHYPKHPFY